MSSSIAFRGVVSRPAGEKYELGQVISVAPTRFQKVGAVLDARYGGTPWSLRSCAEVQVIERSTGDVVFAAEFRQKVALDGMLETVRTDLAHLTSDEFAQQYGISSDSPRAPAGTPCAPYFDSSPRSLLSGLGSAVGVVAGWAKASIPGLGKRGRSGESA